MASTLASRFPRLPFLVASLSMAALAALAPSASEAGSGDCGQPNTSGPAPLASDALETLRTAVGSSSCGGFDFCICDVDASGSVVAGDALRVLKKAVGQNVALVCMCATTTTTTTLPVFETTELLVLVKSQGSYATSDLAGTWDISGLVTGPAAPEWTRGNLDIASNGEFTGTTTESGGSSDDIAGRLSLSANGTLTCTQFCASTFRGAIDPGKTVGTITDTLDGQSPELYVVTRRPASSVQADLAGTWAGMAIESGPGAPWWGRGVFLVQANGSFDGSVVGSDGMNEDLDGTLSLNSSGRITCASAGCPSDFRGALDSGKTLAAITQTRAGSTELLLLVKRGNGYSLSNLTGTWAASTLSTGDTERWSRGTISVSAAGVASGTLTGSDGSMRATGGTLAIDASGNVTNSADADMRCVVDAGKTVLVCTDGW